MLQQLTSAQLTELETMWDLEQGWGSYKEDWRSAHEQATVANVMGGGKKGGGQFDATDFIMQPDVHREKAQKKANQNRNKVRLGLQQLSGLKPKEQKAQQKPPKGSKRGKK